MTTTIQDCYSTWSASYYDAYLGDDALYPPIHVGLVSRLLEEVNATCVLDAGCGPASMMRHLSRLGLDLYGFDLTPEMVEEAHRVALENEIPPDRIWEGSVLDRNAYQQPLGKKIAFDSVICCGVLPHIPEDQDATCIRNIHQALRPGGFAMVSARNKLFSLFSFNRYSHEFFLEQLIPVDSLRALANETGEAIDVAVGDVSGLFNIDKPPLRDYDNVRSRTHNPLHLKSTFERAGFVDVELLFYHFHALPPLIAERVPVLAKRASLEMEVNPKDWRGLFMASAFFVVGRRP